ncbi:MAG: polysaccharide ABC transporter ATP-binding protein [Gammaproteobacteria bacterium]
MSNNKSVIRVEDVSKIFRIGLQDDEKDNLASAAFDFIRSPIKNYKKYRSLYNFDDVLNDGGADGGASNDSVLWALNGVSFEVGQGELLGIIGRNGAGKSTLLKILSRITPPTRGKVTIHGRISSLLEVGTGFHPELTGRDNVYLNGTVLGMRKSEIDKKFDQIVEFSGVERFLDTPVKRYSSGMRVRLAFSVAAHLEPEILIIDEVLAVGDAAFQQKCLGKMEEVGKAGRTVLFVSHSMPAVTRMCSRVILLNQGKVEFDGTPHEVVGRYLRGGTESLAHRQWTDAGKAPQGDVIRLRSVKLRTEDGTITEAFDIRSPIGVEIEYEVLQPEYTLMMSFSLVDDQGYTACVALDQDRTWRGRARPVGTYTTTGWIPGNFLGEGMISLNLYIHTVSPRRSMQIGMRDLVGFQAVDTMEGDSVRGDFPGDLRGAIRPAFKWTTIGNS